MRWLLIALISGFVVLAGGQGVAPRANTSDYDAQQSFADGTLAASVVPAKQIEKLFSSRIAKDFIVVEGAVHGQTPCVPCESFPGQYSNTVKNFYDYVRNWINKRFPSV